MILANTIADLELPIKEKNAEIIIDDLPSIESISGQIRQIFQNIISNALKFAKAGVQPVIRITGEKVSEKSADSMEDPDGRFVRICIEDNGIGFNEIYLDKIFTIFQRLHGRGEYEGTGIGLAIVKKIVEKHNGLLTAKSKEGVGTTFILVLPVEQSQPLVEAGLQTDL